MFEFPKCGKKNQGVECNGTLVPLSDYGLEGAAVLFKAWACTVCTTVIRIDKGNVSRGSVGDRKEREENGRKW